MPPYRETRYGSFRAPRIEIPTNAAKGAMISMSPSVTLKGAVKFSMKKFLGGDMSSSTYTGPGELLLAPSTLGDISIIRLNGTENWSVGRDAFLAATQGVVKDYKSQGIGKSMFSGEGMFVYKISGNGLLWIQSFGAIIRKDVSEFLPLQLSHEQSAISNIWSSSPRFPTERNTSLTTATLLLGIASTFWNVLLPVELSPT